MDATIRIFNRDIEFMGEVDDFTSLFFIRSWNSYGKFEIELDREIHGLQVENYIMINNDPKLSGVIKYVSVEEKESGKVVKVKGFTLSYILKDRITEPPTGKGYDTFNSNTESIMKDLVDHNCISPTNINRKIPKLIRETKHGRGLTTTYQSRYKVLIDELNTLALMSYLGFGIELNVSSKNMQFYVYQGKDLTTSQSVNPPKIFSKEYDNIYDSEFIVSREDSKNTVIVAGQGEDVDRVVQVINNTNTGLDRKELFVDARDINEADNLEDRANEKLSKYQDVVEYDCEVDSSDYQKTWDLGDLVTIKVDNNITLEKQIMEVRLVWDGGFRTEVTFGEPLTSLKEKIERENDKPITENTKTYYNCPQPVTYAKGTQWLEVIE